MTREAPEPDFIFAGGDWIGHVPQSRDGPGAVRSAALLLASMLHTAFPSVPVMHAVGNHDTTPYYSRAPAWRNWEAAWRAEPTLGDAYVQRHFPNTESLTTFQQGGYYVRPLWPRPHQYPAKGLEEGQLAETTDEGGGGDGAQIAAPTVWGLTLNTNDLAIAGGGSEQLRWLAKSLTAIRARGDVAISNSPLIIIP